MKQESGRSMVEMLGVLAIIGVLSVGGIAGYKVAMTKHKANELLNEASKRAVVVATKIAAGQFNASTALNEFESNTINGVGFSVTDNGNGTFSIKLSNMDKNTDVCEQITNMLGTDHINPTIEPNCAGLKYNNDLGSGTSSGGAGTGASWDSNGDGPTTGDQDCSGTPTECQICVKGEWIDSNAKCGANKVCHDGTCSPSELTGTGCAKNSDCTGDSYSDGPYYCNYGGNVDCASGPSGKVGTCTKVSDSLKDDDLAGFVWGDYMDWYSAKNFCAAQNKRMVSISDFNCPYTLAEYRATDADSPWGYCCATKEESDIQGDGCTNFSANIQAIADEVQDAFWLKELTKTSNSCNAFFVYSPPLGYVYGYYRFNDTTSALCK